MPLTATRSDVKWLWLLTVTSLVDDVEERLFGALPDDTWVYPGHGRDTTLGAERPHLAEWRARGW